MTEVRNSAQDASVEMAIWAAGRNGLNLKSEEIGSIASLYAKAAEIFGDAANEMTFRFAERIGFSSHANPVNQPPNVVAAFIQNVGETLAAHSAIPPQDRDIRAMSEQFFDTLDRTERQVRTRIIAAAAVPA